MRHQVFQAILIVKELYCKHTVNYLLGVSAGVNCQVSSLEMDILALSLFRQGPRYNSLFEGAMGKPSYELSDPEPWRGSRPMGPGGIGVRHPPKTYAIFFCSLVISIV